MLVACVDDISIISFVDGNSVNGLNGSSSACLIYVVSVPHIKWCAALNV